MNHAIMILGTGCSSDDWDAQYLLALSYLNFDHQLSLIVMPSAFKDCPWSIKQWNALSLYGLHACYHIDESPHIESTKINWSEARLLLLVKDTSKLLHICHWKNQTHFKSWIEFASAEDTLIIYGLTTNHEYKQILQQWPNEQCYVVNTDGQPHIAIQEDALIEHKQWAQLLTDHKSTLSWK